MMNRTNRDKLALQKYLDEAKDFEVVEDKSRYTNDSRD
jgi:hypothetical protein